MNLTNDEQLALLVAIDKKLNNRKDGLLTEAKATAKAELMDANESIGADRKAIMVNGEKVGEVGLSYATAKPVILADRMADALAYLADIDLVETTPAKGWESHFKVVDENVICLDTGEFVDWVIWEPSRVKCATVRGCEPQKVLDALSAKLGSRAEVAGLLMGGDLYDK